MEKLPPREPWSNSEQALQVLDEVARITTHLPALRTSRHPDNEPAPANTAPRKILHHVDDAGNKGLVHFFPHGDVLGDDDSIALASVMFFYSAGSRRSFRVALSTEGIELLAITGIPEIRPMPPNDPASFIKQDAAEIEYEKYSFSPQRRTPEIQVASSDEATALLSWLKKIDTTT